MYKKDDRSPHQNSIKFYIFIASKGVGLYLGHIFFYCTELFLFFMGSIFCSTVVLVEPLNTRGVYNFISKKAKNSSKFGLVLQWCLVPMLQLLKVWSNLIFFLKSKKVRVIYSKQDRTLPLLKRQFGQNMYGRPLQLSFFTKKSNIRARQSFQSNLLYLKKRQCREHAFLFQLTLTINITPINITLRTLEKK